MHRSVVAALAITLGLVAVSKADELAEIAQWPDTVSMAKDAGIDYPVTVRRARRGDENALTSLFRVTLHMDGSGADSHCAVLRRLLESLGDTHFSRVLRTLAPKTRDRVTHSIDYDFRRPWQKQFPLTYRLGSHDFEPLRENANI